MKFANPFKKKEAIRVEPVIRSTETVTKSDSSLSLGWFRSMANALSGPSHTGIAINARTATNSSSVFAAVKILCRDISNLPIQIIESLPNGGSKKNFSHSVNKLLRRPNPVHTHTEFYYHVVNNYLLNGNIYIYIERDKMGNPIALWPINPDYMSISWDQSTGIQFYNFTDYHLGFTQHSCTYLDLIHIKYFHVNSFPYGLSPISCSDAVGIELAISSHIGNSFRNGVKSSGVLSMPGMISPESAERLAASFRDQYSGLENTGRTPLLENGMTYTPVTMTSVDAQILEQRKFSVQEIAKLFGIPGYMLGDTSASTFGNIESLNQQYVNTALMGIARPLEEALSYMLFPDEPNLELKFSFDELLRGDKKTRFESYQIGLLNGIYSVNECRAEEGLESIPDGDVHRFPLNQSTVTGSVNSIELSGRDDETPND